jgi:hypothetical protein
VTHQFEFVIIQQVLNVLAPAGKKVVQTNYFMTPGNQTVTQMRADKARPTCYKYSHICSDVAQVDNLRFFPGDKERKLSTCATWQKPD